MTRREPQPIGRPRKYDWVLQTLEDDVLYTPASIADLAMALGAERRIPGVDPRKLRTRVRITMGRYGVNNNFPREGDGLAPRKGQAPTPAWLGRRWKEKLPKSKKAPQHAANADDAEYRPQDMIPEQRTPRPECE